MTPRPSTITRAALSLGLTCDNACVFCAQAGVDPSTPSPEPRAALAELRADHDEISFVGGEPTLDPRLPELVAHARALGYAAVGVQTNAGELARDRSRFAALVAAGLSDLHVSIHAPTAAAHDYHTGRPGSLDAIIEVLGWAQRAGLPVVASTVVTRSNFRELVKLPPALKRRGVAGWLIQTVRPYGRAADGFARVVPRFGMALPYALHALEQARRHNLPAWIRGAPHCALGPFAAAAIDEPSSAATIYPEVCGRCLARDRCPGVDPAYVEVFGSKELTARKPEPSASADPWRARVSRMFVGVGPLVARAPRLGTARDPSAPEPEGGKNRRLPVVPATPQSPADLAQSDLDS